MIDTGSGPVHICLVSDTNLPNLNPALANISESRFFPPKRVLLLCGTGHLEQARYLKDTLVDHRLVVDIHTIDDGLDPIEISSLIGQISAVFETLSPEEKQLAVLNASGGGKALSLAAVSVFIRNNLPAFLVDTSNDRIVWLNGEERLTLDIPDNASLEDVLSGNGFKIIPPHPVRHDLNEKQILLGEKMAENVKKFSEVIGAFNGYMSRAKETEGYYQAGPVSHKLYKNHNFMKLVDCFCETGLLEWKKHHLVFRGQDAARFLRGGWFELYGYAVINQIKHDWAEQGYPVQIGDVASGVNIESPTGSRNEIDIAFLCNNRLYLIECKTGYFSPSSHPSGPSSTMLYKLDWLKDLGAPASKTAIFSYRALPDHDRERAQQMHIEVVAGWPDIAKLRVFLENWIEVPQTN
ncbi:hypothetical protein WH96_19090 [Kiloniella spongiae]|uniref:Card1 endonuclease domain-containing protein n=1 Tax=Kiloniella spongiae TaxID=1489064 RepID=A0A0H2MQZ4_9PROT|nr:DUF1887 family CARF protein [Kiloniella spongiae]KLN59095.1 hypothetical protein WH96_19090 [Kiloniella spongiae]